MKRFISNILSACLGLWLAVLFVPGALVSIYPSSSFFGFSLTDSWQVYLLLGVALGLLNSFVKPILDTLSIPLKIITLGFFGFVINAGLVWVIDYIFREFSAPWFWPLFWATAIIYTIHQLVSGFILVDND